MRVLVLGASGFIGRHVMARLLTNGHDVIACGRRPALLARRFPGAETLSVDLTDAAAQQPSFWEGKLAGVDAIINASGVLRARSEAEALAVHLLGPRALADAAGSRPFVHISAVGIEADTFYASTKRAMEKALMESDGVWSILRPSLVYGPTCNGASATIRGLATLPLFVPTIGADEPETTPIHVDDLAAVVERAAEEPRLQRQIIEVGGPERMLLSTFAQKLRGWMGMPRGRVIRAPGWAVGLAARLGDALRLPSLNSTALRQVETRIAAAPSRPLSDVGFRPRSLNQALTAEPAGGQDLLHAQLFFWRAAVRGVLAVFWIGAAALALIAALDLGAARASDPSDPSLWPVCGALLAAAVAVAVAFALLRGWRTLWGSALQIAMVIALALGAASYSEAAGVVPALLAALASLPALCLVITHAVIDRN